MPNTLDHIILLVSPHDFENVPSWLSDNFTIIDGGTHTKGTSRNKLIIFKDGTYLELFSWVDPQPSGVPPHADFPAWANKPEGQIIDFALTGDDAQANYTAMTQRLENSNINVTYSQPAPGGRNRTDGKALKWTTTRPTQQPDNNNSSFTPFFCHDVTPRNLRVQYDDPKITTHPCGATGVAHLITSVPPPHYQSTVDLYGAILGPEGVQTSSLSADQCPSPYVRGTRFGFLPPVTHETQKHTSIDVYVARESAGREVGKQAIYSGNPGFQELVLWTERDERRDRRLDDREGGLGLCFRLE